MCRLSPPAVTQQGLLSPLPTCPTCLPAPLLAVQPAYQAVPGRLIIKMGPNYVSAMGTDSHGLRFDRPAGPRGAAVYTITDGKTVSQKLAEMADNPGEAAGRVVPFVLHTHSDCMIQPESVCCNLTAAHRLPALTCSL